MINRKKTVFPVIYFSLLSWLVYYYFNRDKGKIVKFPKFLGTPLFTDLLWWPLLNKVPTHTGAYLGLLKTFLMKLFVRIVSQKQSSKGVLITMCSKNMQQIYRRTPILKCDFHKVGSPINLL